MPPAISDPAELVIRTGSAADIARFFRNSLPSVVGGALAQLADPDRIKVLTALSPRLAATAFTFLPLETQKMLLNAAPQGVVSLLLDNMPPDDRTRLFQHIPAHETTRLLALMSPKEHREAVALLGYPATSVGSLMTPHYVCVSKDWTVQQVLEHIRHTGQDSETLTMIYVVDPEHRLIDDISIRQFLLAPIDALVSDIMDNKFVALRASQSQEAAVQMFRREDRKALPVLDGKDTLVGIVTIDDMLRVAEAEATRDTQKIGGSEAFDEPYMTIALGRMIKKRAGWLVFLFLGEMLTATAMGFFEKEIEKAVVLALFVPLIISSGGNAGSQAATLVIRALAVGELRLADWWRVMRREILSGLALGIILGIIGFLRIAIWSGFSTVYGPHWLLVALTVGLSLIGIVLWGSLAGSMLPLLMRRLGFDPATSSTPFVATLVDVTGLIIYFSIGIVVLRGTLL
ncbi:MAG: magnesium transporter [Pseudomonadota bacterium]|nr:magnesium transporter [Pseudomonadota bacterium]